MYTFQELIGHQEVIHHIQNSISHKKVSHAYIVDGEEGIGKKTLVLTIAKTLQCMKKGTEPCNHCISCQTFDSGNHPDVIMVQPTKRKSIGVDDIREQIRDDIEIKPYQYPYKIYIIEDGDTMTVAAQNALLKTLEEPPAYGIIFLLSSNYQRFLPTIVSRCVLLQLKPLSQVQVENYMIHRLQIPDYQAKLYAHFAQGNIGKAKKIVKDPIFIEMRNQVIEWVDQIHKVDLVSLFQMQKEFEKYKDQIQEVLDLFYTWYRDILLIKQLGENPYIIHQDQQKYLLKQAQGLSYNRIGQCLDNIRIAKDQLLKNANFQLTIEMLLLKLKES
ncbi:MAG: DNA polymerase III subunit delta' [Epulopiscium sp.]|nr:DNA polymerase III subunit delta' [Candidatus Epulonipiscium sp.]